MTNNKIFKVIKWVLIVAILVMVGMIIGIFFDRSARRFTVTVSSKDKLQTIMNLIDLKYVDNISRDSIYEIFIPQLMESLDPHSVYIPAKDLAAVNEPLQGSFDGIGVMFNMLTDTVLVSNVISGGPSYKAGVMAGDRIISADTTILAGRKMNQDSVVKKLRGERGSKVKLGIERLGNNEILYITVTRGVIPMKSLDAAFMIAPKTGYVKFQRFAETTYEEIMKAMLDLNSKGMDTLIMDLRGNGGGYLEPAIYIANQFLDKDNMIVYTEGVHQQTIKQVADGNGMFKNTELVLLIDEGSASASEILAGAFQDNDRGTIIGRRSFGKGLVQEQIPLRDGSAIRLTVARYHTPSGRCIQRPYDSGLEEYNNDLLRRLNNNELMSADSMPHNDSLKFYTPKGKVVYGGGGIVPDIFVPMDTTALTNYFRELYTKNLIFRYSMTYADTHRAELTKIETLDALNKYFDKQRNLIPDFVAYAAKNGVSPKGDELAKTREILSAQLKGYIGRNTPLDDNALYYYFAPIDNVLNKALGR